MERVKGLELAIEGARLYVETAEKKERAKQVWDSLN